MKGFVLFFVVIFVLLVGCQNPITVVQKDLPAENTVLQPSVQYINNSGMRIVNVNFDSTVNRISAETVTNYTIKNNKTTTVLVQSAKLLDNKKTVQLFLSAGMYNDLLTDSIEIKNIQNADQTTTIDTITKEFVMRDLYSPTVATVEALGAKAIRVTFSEAIQGVAIGAFKLDDISSSITSVNYPDAGDYTKAIINLGNSVSIGAHILTIGINGSLTDYNTTTDGTENGNIMQSAGYKVIIPIDMSVPTLSSVEFLSQNNARYTFSKAIQTPSENAFFWSTSANQTSGIFANKVVKISDNVYEVSWATAINTGNVYFYSGTISDKVIDYSGNSISPLPSCKLVSVTN